MGNVSEPDTRHFLYKDIYTHVTYADLNFNEAAADDNSYEAPKIENLKVGDTTATSNNFMVLKSIGPLTALEKSENQFAENTIAVAADMDVYDINGKLYNARPIFAINNTNEGQITSVPFSIDDIGVMISLNKINPESETFEFSFFEKKSAKRDFIILKAIEFPLINILWLGSILLGIGTILAILHRVKLARA
jgi:cytochrome c-type biogenesis protein CcmF